jgi:hypothetical protein
MDKDNKSDKNYNKRKMSYDDQEGFSETEYVDTKMTVSGVTTFSDSV